MLVLAIGALAALPLFRLLAEGPDDGSVDAEGLWTHDTAPDIGIRVTEATKGFSYLESKSIQLQREEIIIPRAEGITWGYGDLPCGYGLDVELPGGTTLCFIEADGTAATRNLNAKDEPFIADILASATA